jgi:hypothetical protein
MLAFNFSIKRFLQRMVAAGYSPDCLDVTVLPSLAFRVDLADNSSPENVVFFYDAESDGLYATHTQFKMDDAGRQTTDNAKTYYMSPDYRNVLPKFIIDALDAMS